MPNILDQLECNNELEKASNYIRHRRRLRPREFWVYTNTLTVLPCLTNVSTSNAPLCAYALDKDEVDKSHKCCQIRRHYLLETIPLNQVSQICKSTQTLS